MPITKLQSDGIQTTDTSFSISTSNTVAIYVDSSQNVGIGTNSTFGNSKLNVTLGITARNSGAATPYFQLYNANAGSNLKTWRIGGNSDGSIGFESVNDAYSSASEQMRINSTGQLWKGYTSQIFTASAYQFGVSFPGSSSQGIVIKNTENSQAGAAIRFVDYLGNFTGGGIYFQTSGSVSYSASSDYRLKKDVQPITNGLDTITKLNPISFKWKADDSNAEGFIAHELAEHIPNAVIGEKDAVYEDGSVKSQVVDQSKIIAHLVAAIKELKAEIEELKASK